MNAVATLNANSSNVDAYRLSTDAAGICREIVLATASTIQGRKFVSVEGWQAIAVAHGCTAGAHSVEKVEGGVRAIGEIRRMSDGAVISNAEGFVGEDEPTWYGGQSRGKTLPKRADYAIRAMAQTRAISRACRSAFAHVVVMMNANLQTTPAEEVPDGGFDDGNVVDMPARARTVLDGPHTSPTALKAAMAKVEVAVRAADSDVALNAVLAENKVTINQARRDMPILIDGDPEIGEDTGFKGRVEAKRDSFPSAAYAALVASMDGCKTKAGLDEWSREHGDTIEGLPDSETRRFNAAYDALASGLIANAAANPLAAG